MLSKRSIDTTVYKNWAADYCTYWGQRVSDEYAQTDVNYLARPRAACALSAGRLGAAGVGCGMRARATLRRGLVGGTCAAT